jgi:hypothetical protein
VHDELWESYGTVMAGAEEYECQRQRSVLARIPECSLNFNRCYCNCIECSTSQHSVLALLCQADHAPDAINVQRSRHLNLVSELEHGTYACELREDVGRRATGDHSDEMLHAFLHVCIVAVVSGTRTMGGLDSLLQVPLGSRA